MIGGHSHIIRKDMGRVSDGFTILLVCRRGGPLLADPIVGFARNSTKVQELNMCRKPKTPMFSSKAVGVSCPSVIESMKRHDRKA